MIDFEQIAQKSIPGGLISRRTNAMKETLHWPGILGNPSYR